MQESQCLFLKHVLEHRIEVLLHLLVIELSLVLLVAPFKLSPCLLDAFLLLLSLVAKLPGGHLEAGLFLKVVHLLHEFLRFHLGDEASLEPLSENVITLHLHFHDQICRLVKSGSVSDALSGQLGIGAVLVVLVELLVPPVVAHILLTLDALGQILVQEASVLSLS